MKRIKIGIIGTGMAWDRLHYPAFARLQDKYEVVALCDRDKSKALSAAQILNLKEQHVYDRYEDMLNTENIDAVDIIVPISENYEAAKFFIEKKINLIAEKPFASTSESAKELIELANQNGVKVLVAENFRYTEENKIIKKLLDEKAIGNVVYFIDNNVKDFPKEMVKDNFSAKDWRQHPNFKGGIFLDSEIHTIARMRFLFGSHNQVFATGRKCNEDFSPYSNINALIKFDNDITGVYSFFCTGKETQAPCVGLRIFGTEGEIFLEDKNCGCVNLSLKDGTSKGIPYTKEEGYYGEFLNFYQSLALGKEIVSTPEKEVGDIELIEDILLAVEKTKNLYS